MRLRLYIYFVWLLLCGLFSCFGDPLAVYNPANCVPYSLNNTPAWPNYYCRIIPQWYLKDTGEASVVYQDGLIFPSLTEPGGNSDLNLPPDLNAPGVVIGVIDTGCRSDHEDMQGVILGGCFISDRGGSVLINGQYSDYDPNGHGTGIASIIAANRNSIGMRGVAPGAKLLIVSTPLAFPDLLAGHMAKGIEWLVNNGAHIICLSTGEVDTQDTALYLAMNYAMVNGVMIVSAVRYGGNLDTTPSYPYGWNFINYIAVAAVTRQDALYPGSASGSRVYGAPGDRIVMASTDDLYVYDNGNSFASPMVAGVLGLMKSKQINVRRTQFFLNRIKASAALHPVAGIAGRIDAAATLANL